MVVSTVTTLPHQRSPSPAVEAQSQYSCWRRINEQKLLPKTLIFTFVDYFSKTFIWPRPYFYLQHRNITYQDYEPDQKEAKIQDEQHPA